MADNGLGLLLGGAAGFGLYLLVTGLGFGGRGTGNGTQPSRSPDVQRLSFLMTEPSVVGHPAGFKLRGDADPTIYSVASLIARVQEGGRSDVELRATGSVLQGSWAAALEQIKHAGLSVFESGASSPAVVGYTRGRGPARGLYGHGRGRRPR